MMGIHIILKNGNSQISRKTQIMKDKRKIRFLNKYLKLKILIFKLQIYSSRISKLYKSFR